METDKSAESPAFGLVRRSSNGSLLLEPFDAETLASHFKLTPMAVRQHLYALQKEGLVTYHEGLQQLHHFVELNEDFTNTSFRN